MLTDLVGTGESLGEDRGEITGEENGAGLLLVGLRMNDFSFSGFTLPYRKKLTIITNKHNYFMNHLELRDDQFCPILTPNEKKKMELCRFNQKMYQTSKKSLLKFTQHQPNLISGTNLIIPQYRWCSTRPIDVPTRHTIIVHRRAITWMGSIGAYMKVPCQWILEEIMVEIFSYSPEAKHEQIVCVYIKRVQLCLKNS